MNKPHISRPAQAGFTLVELAIVMIIIGLLIGGILKGQELIANARVTSTVSQVKAIDAATSTFQDKYNGMPGDLVAAATRLPARCGANIACVNGNGNGLVDSTTPGVAPGAENQQFFQQLNAADLMSGINSSLGNVVGGFYPTATVGGGFNVAYSVGNVAIPSFPGANASVTAGHYLTLTRNPAGATASTLLTPNQSSRIDTKLDDGAPESGSVLAAGVVGGCLLNATTYNDAVSASNCDLYIRFHQ